ncbi:MAG: hypothetical protein AAGA86_00630 [Bacteroidota bacterium]
MRVKAALLMLAIFSMGFLSCERDDNDDGNLVEYVVATPLMMDRSEFRNSIDILPPQPIEESGKIYAYKDYIFVNDKYRGVHIIDNSNPTNPQKINFIAIAGNVDISVKGNFLYADSLMDLLVFDISNINDIQEVNRLQDVLRDYLVWPVEADAFDWDGLNTGGDQIQVGWETRTERITPEEYEERVQRWNTDLFAEVANDAAGGDTGQGGSLARFKIVGDFLYAVDSHNINIFEISDLANPQDMADVFAGFDIETIFNRGEHLFLGSMRGMYIYDISSPGQPEFVSEFEHGTACDPVVVDGDYAYVTLRGGNGCGATDSGLYIVDISDISVPELTIFYPLDGPYGLGIKDEKLFICDGDSGLKVYDKTDVENLVSLSHFKDITTFDVIPLENHLLMVGDQILYQYRYLEDTIELLSTMDLR